MTPRRAFTGVAALHLSAIVQGKANQPVALRVVNQPQPSPPGHCPTDQSQDPTQAGIAPNGGPQRCINRLMVHATAAKKLAVPRCTKLLVSISDSGQPLLNRLALQRERGGINKPD